MIVEARRRLREAERAAGRADALRSQLEAAREAAREARESKERARKAAILIEAAADEARASIHGAFESIVSDALRAVLGDDYRLVVASDVKRNAAHVDFSVASDEYEEPSDPIASRGGGVVDVLSFALRVVILELARPRVEGPLILDEPFRHVSADRVSAAADLCRAIARRFGRQVIVVSHRPGMVDAADVVVELGAKP